jgi:hypothetical protein
LAGEILLARAFAQVLVRPSLARRQLPGVVLEAIRLGQHEALHVAPIDPLGFQKTGHGVATEEWQVAAEQDSVEARESTLKLVGVRGDELVHSRVAHELRRERNPWLTWLVRILDRGRNPILSPRRHPWSRIGPAIAALLGQPPRSRDADRYSFGLSASNSMPHPLGSEAPRRSRGASLGCGRQAALGNIKAIERNRFAVEGVGPERVAVRVLDSRPSS